MTHGFVLARPHCFHSDGSCQGFTVQTCVNLMYICKQIRIVIKPMLHGLCVYLPLAQTPAHALILRKLGAKLRVNNPSVQRTGIDILLLVKVRLLALTLSMTLRPPVSPSPDTFGIWYGILYIICGTRMKTFKWAERDNLVTMKIFWNGWYLDDMSGVFLSIPEPGGMHGTEPCLDIYVKPSHKRVLDARRAARTQI
jgi:hypothetical protein